MNKRKLSSLQFSCLLTYPILSLYSGIGTFHITNISGVDSYLALLISYLLGFLLLFLFWQIFQYHEDVTILDKNKILFGPILGTIVNILLNLFLFFLGVMLFYNISNFAISQFLDKTPIIIFMILVGVILVYNISMGILNVARVSVIFFAIICFLNLFSFFGLLPYFHFDYLKPVMGNGIQNVIFGGIEFSFVNILPIFALLIVEKGRVSDERTLRNRMFIFYTLAFIFIFLSNILTMGILGVQLVGLYQYPDYTVLEKISLFNFIDRVENVVYIKWILSSVISLSFIVHHVGSIFSRVKVPIRCSAVVMCMIIFSLVIFKNNTSFYEISYSVFPYLCYLLFFIYFFMGMTIFLNKRLCNKL